MQIFVRTGMSKTITLEVENEHTLAKVKELIEEKANIPSDQMRLIFLGKQMTDDNKTMAGYGVKKESMLTVLMRMVGGGFVDAETLYCLLRCEITKVISDAPKVEGDCALCFESLHDCLVTCCRQVICAECFEHQLRAEKFMPKCIICSERVDVSAVTSSRDPLVGHTIQSLEEVTTLLRNIDVQLCDCGTLIVNDTMMSHAKCSTCSRVFCFFCNRIWGQDMRNMRYTCGKDDCDYKERLTFETVSLSCHSKIKIPNRRCCPKCFTVGAYDEKCKYHKCFECQHQFCFICLETNEECLRKYPDSWYQSCAKEPVEQSFNMFPRLS